MQKNKKFLYCFSFYLIFVKCMQYKLYLIQNKGCIIRFYKIIRINNILLVTFYQSLKLYK